LITVNVKGERELFAAIDRLTELVSDQRERGWQENVDVRLDYQRRHMDSEFAGGWTPLDDAYRLRKIEEVGALPILQYSGSLNRSLTQEGATGYVREESAESLRVGSANPLARYHHYGAGRLPVREVIVISTAEGREHMEVFENSYADHARSLGFRVS
jgi:phage gpG-like protein